MVGRPWGGFVWGGAVRMVIVHQVTFMINSVAHSFGKRTFDHEGTARDNPLLAVFTFGEGYHSFHHRFPFDYRGSVHWWQYDPSKWLIWSLARLRLVNKVRSASPGTVARAAAAARPT
jgi:stearoyl-CoA desaturase (delta-9 desaturase)